MPFPSRDLALCSGTGKTGCLTIMQARPLSCPNLVRHWSDTGVQRGVRPDAIAEIDLPAGRSVWSVQFSTDDEPADPMAYDVEGGPGAAGEQPAPERVTGRKRRADDADGAPLSPALGRVRH
jgi:hypothetical protein